MSGILDTLKKYIVYHEPKDIDGYELLETDYEGTVRDGFEEGMLEEQEQQEQQKNKDESQKKKSEEKKKSPLKVDEWNKTKNKDDEAVPKTPEDMVDTRLNVNLERIQKEFKSPTNSDIIIRKFKIAQKYNAFLAFIDGMVDRNIISNFILRQLMLPELFENFQGGCPIDFIENNVLAVHDTKRVNKFDMVIRQMCNGLTVLFVEDCDECVLFETRGYEKRSVEKPATEAVINGPQEGFNENLRTNLTLIRRIVKNSSLLTEVLPIGKTNKSFCGIMYVDGIANPKVVKEVKRRINNLNIDFIQSDGILEQLMEEKAFMLFPQVVRTERPDRAAAFLMEGMVLILVDGSPFVIAVPITFYHLLHTSEDSNLKWQFGTLLRFIRLFAIIIATLLPGLYIGLTLFHQEMIPTDLLASIAKSRENVPFPVVIEIIVMEVSFELIREAGIRIPGVIGTTLGIIGALILGQAAVAAGIVSPILIIVVAVTGLGNFAVPNFSVAFTIRILRFLFIFLGAMSGFYAISVGIFIILGFMCSMKSFGVPYLSPVAPKTKIGHDLIARMPAHTQTQRPDNMNTLNRKRAADEPRGWLKRDKGGAKK